MECINRVDACTDMVGALQNTPKDSKAQHIIKANEIKTTDYFEDILKNYL
jgi:hypothetical protein